MAASENKLGLLYTLFNELLLSVWILTNEQIQMFSFGRLQFVILSCKHINSSPSNFNSYDMVTT